MKVLVTGISSYLAKCLVPKLEQDEDIEEIIGIDIIPIQRAYKKVRFHQADIRDPDLVQYFKSADVVVHLAFIVAEIKDKKRTYDININGTRNVLTACCKAGVKKVIIASSLAAYGAHPDNPVPITEESPLRGNKNSYYSLNKVQMEMLVEDFCRENPDIIVTRLRPAVIFGPKSHTSFAVALSKRVFWGIRGRDPVHHLVHEEDAAEAFYLAIKKDAHGIYNVVDDEPIALSECAKLSGQKYVRIGEGVAKFLANIGFWLGLLEYSGHWVVLIGHSIIASNEKIKNELGWEPRYTTTETLQATLEIWNREGN